MNAKRISIFVASIFLISLPLTASEKTPDVSVRPEISPESRQISGTFDKLNWNQSIVVRVGDATQTFSFDNATVFTYGDHSSRPDDLKIGDALLVTVEKGKAQKVNATERIEGIIEQIDSIGKMLIVKIGERTKQIPFNYFEVAGPDGKTASVSDMQVGDTVVLNLNLGLPDKAPAKK